MSELEKSLSLQIVGAIASYSLCSSTLLLANKAVMLFLPRPSIVSLIQVVSSLFIMYFINMHGIKMDKLEWAKVKLYSVYVLAFTLSRYANMKALHSSNIETVVVFRACVPFVVSFIEYALMGRALPSARALSSLVVVGVGAIIYCVSDSEFSLNGLGAYSWVSIYFVLLTFEMTYCKQLTSSAKMNSKWGPVFYCNFLATIPIILLGVVTGEFKDLVTSFESIPLSGILVLIFSCIAGTFIGYMHHTVFAHRISLSLVCRYTSWSCIDLLSATSYTLVGVVNKFLTVLLNVIIWDKHSTPLGLFAVCLCLGGGVFYEQAPMRKDPRHVVSRSDSHKDHPPPIKL